jgi:3-isopropylmalate/(R)-2-methylmalate dehydratase small subunit
LHDFGIRSLIAPSFADIFHGNCFKNGILPIVLNESLVEQLFANVAATAGYRVQIDLAAQTIAMPDGASIPFEVDPFRKRCLLEGLDDIALTLVHEEDIRRYEQRRRTTEAWLFPQHEGAP